MKYRLILNTPNRLLGLASLGDFFNENNIIIQPVDRPKGFSQHFFLELPELIDDKMVIGGIFPWAQAHSIDFSLQPELLRGCFQLMVLDCDMTVLQCEVIDELAKVVGVTEEVASITRQAMEGQLPFQESLRQRVRLLKGLRVEVLTQFAEKLPYTEGFAEMVRVLKSKNFRLAIVSGGFDVILEVIQQQFSLDRVAANRLEVHNGVLTGRVYDPIVDASYKAEFLKKLATSYGIGLDHTIAVGDGANDALMLDLAGLGVAFCAKPYLHEFATAALFQPDMKNLLDLL